MRRRSTTTVLISEASRVIQETVSVLSEPESGAAHTHHKTPDGWVRDGIFPPGASAWKTPEVQETSNQRACNERLEISMPSPPPLIQSALNVNKVSHRP